MTAPAKVNLKIYQGATFKQVFRWESETKVYAAISAVAKSAPVRITLADPLQVPPLGWRAWVVGVLGMKELNNTEDNYYQVTNNTGGVVEINSVNASQFGTYTTGGHLVYNLPVPLSNYTSGRLQIRKKITDTEPVLTLTTENGGIVLDAQNHQLLVVITATQTALLDFTSAVYDLELVDFQGGVVRFAQGSLLLSDEVTR